MDFQFCINAAFVHFSLHSRFITLSLHLVLVFSQHMLTNCSALWDFTCELVLFQIFQGNKQHALFFLHMTAVTPNDLLMFKQIVATLLKIVPERTTMRFSTEEPFSVPQRTIQ